MSEKLKICILSEYAYSLLANKGKRVGGAELQTVTIAKELVKRSYDVSFVTFEKSSSLVEVINGIKVYNLFNNLGKGCVTLYPQHLYKVLRILNRIDADVYIQKGTTPLTGMIAFFAKFRNRIFLHAASSEKNVSINLKITSIKDFKNLFYRFGVKYCDCVICQTNHQKKLLKQTIHRDGKVIKNLYIPTGVEYNQSTISKLKVLWVGRIIKEKRPELFLRLAKKVPDVSFWMIGSPSASNPEYYENIKEAARKINNLDFIGFVLHNEIGKYYAKA